MTSPDKEPVAEDQFDDNVEAFDSQYFEPLRWRRTVAPIPVSPRRVSRSREALHYYRNQVYLEPGAWRTLVSPFTQLPALLPGRWPPADAAYFDEKSSLIEEASSWLQSQALLLQSLTGLDDPGEVLADLRVVAINVRRSPGGRRSARITWQQTFAQEIPVFGGRMALHVVEDAELIRFVSSYVPVAVDLEPPGQAISRVEAEVIARETLFLLANADGDAWEVTPNSRINGEEHRILYPFNGRFHLAYEFYARQGDGDDVRRVVVDAASGRVLGPPTGERVHLTADIFPSSAAALAGTPTMAVDEQLLQDIDSFLAVTLPPGGFGALTPELRNEVLSIAHHSQALYQHIVNVGEYKDTEEAQLQFFNGISPALTAVPGQSAMGGQLVMGFAHSTREITYQSAPAPGGFLLSDATAVHHPALDPEIIYHEMFHGLSFLLNDDPFTMRNEVPFARALCEGYAIYFARSVAQPKDPNALWARAGYQEGDWGERWSLSRVPSVAGADYLPLPNLYPFGSQEGMAVYDVGMIFARALWDIRTFLQDELGDVDGAKKADSLALSGYIFALGYLASFELAAEGIVYHAGPADLNLGSFVVDRIIDIFSARGIPTKRGPTALLVTEHDMWLVGMENGVFATFDEGESWQAWSNFPGGVVALLRNGNLLYAVTETGVYRQDAAEFSTDWELMGPWPAAERPLSATVIGSELYVGTARGIWGWDDSNPVPAWQRWGQENHYCWRILASSFAGVRMLIVADTDSPVMFRRDVANGDWSDWGGVDAAHLCLLEHEGNFYFGGFSGDIDHAVDITTARQQLLNLPDPVLCLASRDQTLLAGTGNGLYAIDIQSASAQLITEFSTPTPVTDIAVIDDRLLLTTPTRLWRGTSMPGDFWDWVVI